MQQTRPRLLVKAYAETPYNIIGFEGRFYAAHQEDGAFDIEKFRAGSKFPAYVGKTIDEVAQNIDAGFDNRMLRDIITGFGWRGRRGVAVELGPHSDDFMLDAFFGSIDDAATALRGALRNENGPFTLIGSRDQTALLAEALSKDGHAIWELTLPIAAVREMIAVFDYNVGDPDRFARKPETLADHRRYFRAGVKGVSVKAASARRGSRSARPPRPARRPAW